MRRTPPATSSSTAASIFGAACLSPIVTPTSPGARSSSADASPAAWARVRAASGDVPPMAW
jgi:hypothetical protein